MPGSTLCYLPRVLLRIGLLLSLLQHCCHNASLPPYRHAASTHKVVSGSTGGVVYSSNEKHRASQTDKADHLLPATTETNEEKLTALSKPPSSESPGEEGLDEHPQLTPQTSSPPVYTSESPGEKGLSEGPQLTTQTPPNQPTVAPPTTSEPVVIQPPVDVLLEFINASAVRISWKYPNEDPSHPVHFMVYYSHDGDPYVNAAAQPVRGRSYVFSGMLYGGYYQFQVVAIQGRSTSEPTTTDYFINGITAPPGPPINVRASTLSPSEIDLEWDGPLSPTPLLYLIQWGDNLTKLDKVKEVYQSTHVTFGDLEPGHTYYFRLRADISGRMSILTKPISAETYKIDLPPVHILVEECVIHTTWISIKWSKPSATSFPLPVNSFTVYYSERKMENPISAATEEEIGDVGGNKSTLAKCGAGGSDGRLMPHSDSVTVPGDVCTVNVTRLDPGTMYVFCVGYSSGKFVSDWSASQELSTLDDISCSLCSPHSSTEVLLKWSIKSSSRVDLSHTLSVYQITHTRTLVANYTLNASEPSLTPSEGEILVGDLRPWSNYSFEVGYPSPVGRGAVWTKCPTTHCHTLQGIPLVPPANLTVLSVTATTVTLTWETPPLDTLNGRLVGYTFEYRCHPSVTCPTLSCPELHHRVQATSQDERKMSYQFDELLPFVNYTFEVAAETSAGSGPFSFSVTMETKQTAPSAPPVNVRLVAVSETSVCLEWEEPPACTWNGVIVSYTVHVAPVAPSHRGLYFGDFVNPLTNESTMMSFGGQLGTRTLSWREISVPGTHANIGDLRPMTEYSITVAAATTEGTGPFSTPVIVSTLESVINRSVNTSLSVTVAEKLTEECSSVNVSWKQLLSQEAGLFLPNSTDNAATVSDNWEFFIHFLSVTPGINDSGVISVDGNDSLYTLPADTLIHGTRYKLWITVDALLSNGTTLHIHSLQTTTQIPTCSVGPYNPRTWTVAAVVLVVFLVLLLALCLLSVCFYRWWRKSSVPRPMLINMESYTSVAVDSDEGSVIVPGQLATADRQRGDGWSNSTSSGSSSEESVKSGSSVMTSEESADVDSQEEMETAPGESGVGVASLPATLLWPEHNEGYVRSSATTSSNEQPLCDLPLAPRQQPDGCSITSSSSQSSLLDCSIDT